MWPETRSVPSGAIHRSFSEEKQNICIVKKERGREEGEERVQWGRLDTVRVQ